MVIDTLVVHRHYRLIRIIGEGGMGKVWLAEDMHDGRMVAVKQLHPALASDPVKVRRFEREATLLRKLDHPNIVKVYAFFEERSRFYLVMRLVPGGSLYDLIRRAGPLPVPVVRRVGIDLCGALECAHRLGVIHRDIKPENILLTEDGDPVLTDFGLARFKIGTALTEQGAIVGSLSHVSPEECRGQRADERSDIWSLGVTLYETLTGVAPFERPTLMTTVGAIVREPLPPFERYRRDVPPELAAAVRGMLEKDPDKRISDAPAAAEALRRVPASPAPEAPSDEPGDHDGDDDAGGMLRRLYRRLSRGDRCP
ncbi:MAG: serine/threonine protein kinase [Anaerolineae bacterium]|nr:serine/threonine protein kinase [Anaerolineae bacterium]